MIDENKELSYCADIFRNMIKTIKNLISIMSHLQPHYHFEQDFQKVDQHTGGKWLIHGTKHRKGNRLQSPKLPCRIS